MDLLWDVVEGHHALMDHRYEFLGLNLSPNQALAEAARRADRLEPYSGTSFKIVPARYRAPAITVDDALAVATAELRRLQAEHPNVTWEPVRRAESMEHPMFYNFHSIGREWQEQGFIPGALISIVDRYDGHRQTKTSGCGPDSLSGPSCT